MAIKVKGLRSTTSLIENIGARSSRDIRGILLEGAERIQERAKEYVPVDDGDLESAIIITKDRGGLNRRNRYIVGVDEEQINSSGRPIGKYSEFIHEEVYNLGPKSIAKAQSTGKAVGRKFLERAFNDFEAEINADVQSAISRITK